MSYVQGFVIPVPNSNKEAYRKLATDVAPLFYDYGAQHIVECWGDDLPHGEQTDFYRAVQAEEKENAVFSWIAWESREICDAAHEKMMSDERMAEPPDNPFDGKRMIYGGFEALSELSGADGPVGYVRGYVAPAPMAKKAGFAEMAGTMGAIATDHGAVSACDYWGVDIADGENTDFKKAVQAAAEEAVAFGFTTWTSKEAHDAAVPKMQADERMPAPDSDMPVDGRRLIFGGFEVLMDGKPAA